MFVIGERVKKEQNPTNRFRLHVTSMSGDADHYETRTADFTTDDEGRLKLGATIALFAAYFKMFWNDQCDQRKVKTIIEAVGSQLGFNNPMESTYRNLVGLDVTNPGGNILQQPDELQVTFFDANGIEHEVKFTYNGEEYQYFLRNS